ncbi:non-homologous end-joining DNA ligase [Streptomyces sp. Je 1-4]|uniref:non-homologous end-joining DNA ligase n=1 Tax=Streptomyces TaxID=1883 RepID=UPI0021D935F2|nr:MULTISPECIES: non-homologous end-joining DNA ligase [unclassified Streptomyces]UYB43752.1 non-homologous end-joining DNA ligase [Streptomyces sp. Je 1-4]UZQ40160.1 non-homologous end-joining DNA ligase [Streptomyces sp. Je 1-4] [Streptomyces sp. Je 1-4 4N24]UZQ47577.1 non-homologous end-joining DNA ligase [Streptomyces sp. Je 1-4] [Streptomyces sp. Je 1-4 4N24_ara]
MNDTETGARADTRTNTVRAGRRTVGIHRPEKVLFPDDGLTKADVVGYYRRVAASMVPQLRGRPLMLERLPEGLGGPHFMQKDTPAHYPDWIRRAEVTNEGGTVTHTVCDEKATLLFLADQACLTFHRWLSRAARPDHPDRLVFDLDPPGPDFEAVREAARQLCGLLDELGLPAVLMTTGSKGLHVIVPLDGKSDFDTVRGFAQEAAAVLAERRPDRLTTAVRKKSRGNRLYLDVQRNAYAQTAVAPWSLRAKPGAPVAAPITREQLDDPQLTAQSWTLKDVAGVLEQAGTRPWSGVPARGRSLRTARRRLDALR